jgi:hypothetical protein
MLNKRKTVGLAFATTLFMTYKAVQNLFAYFTCPVVVLRAGLVLFMLTSAGSQGALAAGESSLTVQETYWLQSALPVLTYAKEMGLPISITVQPQAAPEATPVALGMANGVCKLIFSMRGNEIVGTLLEGVPTGEQGFMIEAIIAHEIGHCWRHIRSKWNSVPDGYKEPAEKKGIRADLLVDIKAARVQQREEGYADLVALFWIKKNHPSAFAEVYEWLLNKREKTAAQSIYNTNNTTEFLKSVRGMMTIDTNETPFDRAQVVWEKILLTSH